MEQYKSRKFILSLIAIVSVSVSFWLGQLTSEQYLFGLSFATGVYLGANVLQKQFTSNGEALGKP